MKKEKIMENSEKKIKSFIRTGKTARVILWCIFLLTAALLITGAVFMTFTGEADKEAAPFNAETSAKGTYSYIDAVGVSDWMYKYSYNSTKEIFYCVLDTEGHLNFATISDGNYAKMTAQRAYWEDESEDAAVPEPYRIYGEAWPLNASLTTRNALYDVSGAESDGEFRDYFGQMYLLGGYNPMEETASGFWVAALFLFLFGMVVLTCCAPVSKKTRKSLKALKEARKVEEAAEELAEGNAIGPCVIGENYLFVRKQGVAIALSGIRSAAVYAKSIRMRTDVLGEITVADLKGGESEQIFDALPIEGGTEEVVKVKSR